MRAAICLQCGRCSQTTAQPGRPGAPHPGREPRSQVNRLRGKPARSSHSQAALCLRRQGRGVMPVDLGRCTGAARRAGRSRSSARAARPAPFCSTRGVAATGGRFAKAADRRPRSFPAGKAGHWTSPRSVVSSTPLPAKRDYLKRSRPHWMRHAHASHALDRHAPIHLVQATLGHASVSTTGRYLHARPNESSGLYLPD